MRRWLRSANRRTRHDESGGGQPANGTQASIAAVQPGRRNAVGLLSIDSLGDLAGDHIRGAPDGIDVEVCVSLCCAGLSVAEQLSDHGEPEAGAGPDTGE